jgi:hypothetical protein
MLRVSRLSCSFALALAVLGLGCARVTHDDPIMGNTNWLRACDADTDCVADAICACGVCTRACDGADVCDDLAGASCDATAAGGACADVLQSAAGVCLAGCTGNAECPDGTQCRNGSCIGAAAMAPSDAGADAGEDAGADAGLALTRRGALVTITSAYTACSAHQDCTLVDTGCNGCCQLGAITREFESNYTANFELACEGYSGGICDCQPPDLVARCEDGACQAVDRAAVADCFSPTQNHETAYDPGAVGCPCSELEAQICVPPAALVCAAVGGTGRLAWTAVEDGPCEPRDPACAGGQVTADASECLATSTDCYQLESGEFCAMP